MNGVKEKLKHLFPRGIWNIKESSVGESKQAYVADNGQKRLFIKFGVRSSVLKRLSELGVTPTLVYEGIEESRPYVIQEFVEGKNPEKSWYANNIEQLAEFIRKYHKDEMLKNILSSGPPQAYQDHIISELEYMDENLTGVQSDAFKRKELKDGINRLKEQSKNLKLVPLVPTHSDPNPQNFLLTPKGLTMVDWDDIVLSDPMKDISLVLWWYIPKGKWSDFFKAYGQELDEEKIYWWIARATLSIAAWYDKRGNNEYAKFFVDDFLLALEHTDNSQIFSNQ